MIVAMIIYVVALALLFVVMQPAAPLATSLAALVGIVSLGLAQGRKFRPWTDALAWLATAACVTLVGEPGHNRPIQLVATAVAACAAVAVLHIPPRRAPPVQGARLVAQWLSVGIAVALVAWLPVWLRADQSLALWDPVSSAGIALRALLWTAVLGGLAFVVNLMRGYMARKESQQDEAEAS